MNRGCRGHPSCCHPLLHFKTRQLMALTSTFHLPGFIQHRRLDYSMIKVQVISSIELVTLPFLFPRRIKALKHQTMVAKSTEHGWIQSIHVFSISFSLSPDAYKYGLHHTERQRRKMQRAPNSRETKSSIQAGVHCWQWTEADASSLWVWAKNWEGQTAETVDHSFSLISDVSSLSISLLRHSPDIHLQLQTSLSRLLLQLKTLPGGLLLHFHQICHLQSGPVVIAIGGASAHKSWLSVTLQNGWTLKQAQKNNGGIHTSTKLIHHRQVRK